MTHRICANFLEMKRWNWNETLSWNWQAHRSLRVKLAPRNQPRLVILRLHHFQIKDPLIREARQNLNFTDNQLILENYSPEVLSQWAEYKYVMAELYKRGLKPALLYPRYQAASESGLPRSKNQVHTIKNLLRPLFPEKDCRGLGGSICEVASSITRLLQVRSVIVCIDRLSLCPVVNIFCLS